MREIRCRKPAAHVTKELSKMPREPICSAVSCRVSKLPREAFCNGMRGSKDPSESDENNNFDQNYKKIADCNGIVNK